MDTRQNATTTKTQVTEEKATETILLVEDDNQLRELARTILSSRGYTVLIADRPENAEGVCRKYEGEIDLLLTDVVMPGMSGKEVAEVVRQLRPGIKVLFMSGYTRDSVIQRGVQDDSRAFLQKPFSPFTLVAKIRDLLDQQTEMSASQESSS